MHGTLGVIVAGGRGRRLGGPQPKALAVVDGRTLLERAIETLSAVCETLVIAAPPTLALPIDPAWRVDDAPGPGGPIAGVVAGLRSRPHESAIVLGVDFPLVRPAALEVLLEILGDRGAVLPAPGGLPQPLVAAYGPSAATLIGERHALGEDSIVRAALALSPLVLDEDTLSELDGGLDNFIDVDTPEDLEAIVARLARRGDEA